MGLATDPSPDLRIGLLRLVEDTVTRMSVPDEAKMLEPAVWQGISAMKLKAFALLAHVNDGVKESVLRCLHKLVIIQSPNDPNSVSTGPDTVSLNLIPANHRHLKAQDLAAESVGLLRHLQSYLVTPAVSAGPLTANINCLLTLSKARPQYLQSVITTLVSWTGIAPPMSDLQRRCVQRTIKIALLSILRFPPASAFVEILADALQLMGAKPHEIQSARRKDLKRPAQNSTLDGDFKRVKTEPIQQASITPTSYVGNQAVAPMVQSAQPLTIEALRALDVTAFPASVVAEWVVQIIASCDQSRWNAGIEKFRATAGLKTVPVIEGLQGAASSSAAAPSMPGDASEIGQSLPLKQEPSGNAVNQLMDPLANNDMDESDPDIYTAQEPPRLPSLPPVPTDVEVKGAPDDPDPAPEDVPGAPGVGVPVAAIELPDVDSVGMNAEQQKSMEKAAVRRILDLESSFAQSGAAGTVALSATAAAAAAAPGGGAGSGGGAVASGGAVYNARSTARTGWMQILSRLTTSLGTEAQGGAPGDAELKSLVVDNLLEDFKNRHELAVTWLHHLWVEDEQRSQQAAASDVAPAPSEYQKWFHVILNHIVDKFPAKDKTFAKFLIDVPEVPAAAIDTVVKQQCESEDRMQLGLFTLQGLINHRPAVREQTLHMLMSYATHPLKLTRATAIVMCKRFFGDHRAITPEIEAFASNCVNQLKGPPPSPPPVVKEEEPMEVVDPATDAAKNEAAKVEAAPAPDAVDAVDEDRKREEVKPVDDAMEETTTEIKDEESVNASPGVWSEADVVRHLELYYALCSKKHDLLFHVFELYKDLVPPVQRAIRTSIVPLIKALATQPTRLVPLIRAFPEGSDPLILRVLTIMTEKEPPSMVVVELVRKAFLERNLDARFLIPVLAGLNRVEILQYLPRIVLILDGSEAIRKLVREAFITLVERPSLRNAAASSSGSITSSNPTISGTGGPPLSPSELLVALHSMEDTVGLKRAVEATNICFSYGEVYKQEVLAVTLQQLVDQSRLPTLFMRTVIQSVTQHPGLVSFVASMLLKLINKKVWTLPKLWDGFMIFPSSVQILQSLPKPQALDALKRSPKLKTALIAHLADMDPEKRARRDIWVLSALVEEPTVVAVKKEEERTDANEDKTATTESVVDAIDSRPQLPEAVVARSASLVE
ncbi:hypothetical protein HKX48_007312 [Thoreauomyces humboldtii]|nr:hypothetical protein HKX48_007312 [Thoreauomyces humboldtii]